MICLEQIPKTTKRILWSEFRSAIRILLAPKLRTMRQFAEEEIVVPNGPFPNRLFDCNRQPYAAAWFELVDSGLWNRFFATGCTQSGKTLSCFVIPLLYHLFEWQETVICLVPKMEIGEDKWTQDILPVILKSKYKDQLPVKGKGSKGGFSESIMFRNGVTLKFMSGNGDDKNRSSYTSRVVVITEVDGMDEASETSREADPITQVEARTLAYGSRKRIYGECTVSIESGRTWQEYTKGTETRLMVQCHDCKSYVTPEREDIHGWHDAENILEARVRGQFSCPSCGVLWSEAQRKELNRNAIAVHRGQEVIDGNVTGELPKTDTLGFRWNAFNNMFWESADISAGEWSASKAENQENAEKEQLQFKWAKPYVPDAVDSMPLDAQMIMARSVNHLERCVVPPSNHVLTLQCDVGKWLLHWACESWSAEGTPHVVAYGELPVESDKVSVERAILIALENLHVLCEAGFDLAGHGKLQPMKVFIDSGYQTDVVYAFCRSKKGGRYWPVKGFGANPKLRGAYSKPSGIGNHVKFIGEEYHVTQLSNGVLLVEINVDYWKLFFHKRLTTPLGLPGAMTLHHGQGNYHSEYAKHLTAEKLVEEFVKDKGIVRKWVQTQKKNHYFDATTYGGPAAHMCGIRLVSSLAEPPKVPAPAKPVDDPDKHFVRQPLTDTRGGWIRRRSAVETT